MIAVKTFDATGVAPNGKLYAGDLNAIQAAAAGLSDFTQVLDLGTLRIGENGLALSRIGSLIAQLSGDLTVTQILRGLNGLVAGTYTTAQRNAIPAGRRPYGIVIMNSDTNQLEQNKGSDAVPNWLPVAASVGANSITATELADNAVDIAAIQDNAVTFAKLAAALKPSGGAAAGAEALRAIGSGAGNVVAGNDSRLTDQRVPTDDSVTASKINTALKPSAGAGAATEALRALGTGAGNAAAGNDARLSDQRTPVDNSVTQAKMADNSVGTPELIDNSVTNPKMADNSVGLAELIAGVGGGDDYGTTLPSSGLFNGYRFTLFLNNQAYDLVYRSDIDATYPWQVMGGAPIIAAGYQYGYITAAWNTVVSVTAPRNGKYRVHAKSSAHMVQGLTEVSRLVVAGTEILKNPGTPVGGGSHGMIDNVGTYDLTSGQTAELQQISQGSDGTHLVGDIVMIPLRF